MMKKINIKELMRYIARTLTIAFLICCVVTAIVTPINEKYRDCGIIKSRSTDEITIKNGTRTELYLNVQFEKAGFKSIKCTPSLYFQKKVGDYVCFDLRKENNNSIFIFISIGWVVIGITCIVALVAFLMLIFD